MNTNYSISTEIRFNPLELVVHRTRAPVRSVILMIEGKGVVPTGD
jgi:hypothetical protein